MTREEKVEHGAILLAESISDVLSAFYSDSADTRSSEIKSAERKENTAYEYLANGTNNEIENAFKKAVSKYNKNDGQLMSSMKISWAKIENAKRAQLKKNGRNVMTIEQEKAASKVDEKTQSDSPAVLHDAKGENVNREVVNK